MDETKNEIKNLIDQVDDERLLEFLLSQIAETIDYYS